jgi:transcriptional regulator with XRE-family HTH domain
MESYSDRLKAALAERGKKAPWLAERVGVTKSAVYQWLNGESKSMKQQNLIDSAHALGVRAEWLVYGKGPMLPSGPEEGKEARDTHSDAAAIQYWRSSPAARSLSQEILALSEAGSIDDRVLDSLLQLVREVSGAARTNQLERIRDLPNDAG